MKKFYESNGWGGYSNFESDLGDIIRDRGQFGESIERQIKNVSSYLEGLTQILIDRNIMTERDALVIMGEQNNYLIEGDVSDDE